MTFLFYLSNYFTSHLCSSDFTNCTEIHCTAQQYPALQSKPLGLALLVNICSVKKEVSIFYIQGCLSTGSGH